MQNLFTVTLLLLFSINSLAQKEDTILHRVTEDTCIGTTVRQYDQMLKYFIEDKTEINQLYKVDLFQLAMCRFNFSWEQKTGENSSIEPFIQAAAIPFRRYSTRINPLSLFNVNTQPPVYIVRFGGDFKYYYNRERRIRMGKPVNGFSANYFSIGASANLSLFDSQWYEVNEWGGLTSIEQHPWGETERHVYEPPRLWSSAPEDKLQGTSGKFHRRESIIALNAGYGLQRRIGNIGYYGGEIKVGYGWNKSLTTQYILVNISFKAGFAISSFKNTGK
jgi:hypothetical protein